ncbi:MAG: hypothetical protein ACUVXF_03565 [Desulfobaccales bacterium]
MLRYILPYEVKPGPNLPEGLPRQSLVVLSRIWHGPFLYLRYPDGEAELLEGLTLSGKVCDLQVFWTQKDAGGPAVCLAIGGDAGLRRVIRKGEGAVTKGAPFLALAESLIPAEVRAVIGPAPEDRPLLPG